MHNFYSVFEAQCDIRKSKRLCWKDIMIALEEGQRKSQAIKFIEKMGWKVGDEECICPYCSDGIKNKDVKLRLVRS